MVVTLKKDYKGRVIVGQRVKRKYVRRKMTKGDHKILTNFIMRTVIAIIMVSLAWSSVQASNTFSIIQNTKVEERVVFVEKELSPELQIRAIAEEMKFTWPDYLIRLARCENDTLDEKRSNTKNNIPADSIDRGIFMINDYWHSEVSNECAYDLDCATRWTIERINAGFQSEWVCSKYIK